MSRTGKIARLPKQIREQLNHRLQDNEPGPELVSWLNGLPEVTEILADRFGGRPVNEVNLTEWRQGGFLEWERHEEARALVGNVAERAQDLEWEAEGVAIADRLAALLATELTLYAETVLRETADPKERWNRLQAMLREVSRLRREDHRAARVAIERERWQSEVDRRKQEESEKERKLAKARVLAPIFAKAEANALAEVLGGDAEAKEVAAYVMEQQHDLKPGTLGKGPTPPNATANDAAPKMKQPKAKVKAKKRAASAARRRQRNRRRPAPSRRRTAVEETAAPAAPPEPDLESADGLEEAGAAQPPAGETESPAPAPQEPQQSPSGESPETREN
jgi:hypothetical protein